MAGKNCLGYPFISRHGGGGKVGFWILRGKVTPAQQPQAGELMAYFEAYGAFALKVIGALTLIAFLLGGVVLLFRQLYEENLALDPSNPRKAFWKTVREYIFGELVGGLLALLLLLPIIIILVGAFVGYLIFGWRQLLGAFS